MTTRFVTGSGTGVGKTFVTAALIHQTLRAGGRIGALKPVISGYDPERIGESDAGVILAALGRPASQAAAEAISPWRFARPVSPHMAAAAEGTAIDFEALVGFCREEMARAAAEDADLLIEGVGGVMVPLCPGRTVLDWMAALDVPAILVGGSYLGALSHTLSAARVLETAGIAIAAVVVSQSAGDDVGLTETVETLRDYLPDRCVLALPRVGDGPGPWRAAAPLTEALTRA